MRDASASVPRPQMHATLKQLRAFVAIAESRSFVEACFVLHLSQPALSAAIRNLEEAVGGTLLARTTRTMSLTPEGEAFLPVARQLLTDWDNAFNDLNNLFAKRRGKLNIAAMPSFAANQLPYALAHFHQWYPNINIAIHDVIAEQVVEMVRAGRVEFGITFDPDEGDDLIFTPLFNDRFVAAVPKSHPLSTKRQVYWQDLESSPLLLLQHPSNIRRQIEAVIAEYRFNFSVEAESHQLATIGRMIANGLGVSIIPSLCIEQMEEIGAVCRPLKKPEISRRVGILTRRRYPLSAAAQEMVATLKKHIRE